MKTEVSEAHRTEKRRENCGGRHNVMEPWTRHRSRKILCNKRSSFIRLTSAV